MNTISNISSFSKLTNDELYMIDGGKGVVNIVSGITAVAGVVGCIYPPAFLVAGIGGCFLVGYGVGEAIRG